jgi:hypothetical protein
VRDARDPDSREAEAIMTDAIAERDMNDAERQRLIRDLCRTTKPGPLI